MLRLCLTLVSVTALSSFAFAQGSGLATAPAATVQKHEQLIFQYRQTSRDSKLDSRYTKNFQMVYGAFQNVELAFDTDLDDDLRFGARYVFHKGDNGLLASVGIADAFDLPRFYVGAKTDLRPGHELHFGVHQQNEGQGFVGYRFSPAPKLRLTADHMTGDKGQTGFRADYDLTSNWRVTTRLYFPNNRDPRTHRLEITYRLDGISF